MMVNIINEQRHIQNQISLLVFCNSIYTFISFFEVKFKSELKLFFFFPQDLDQGKN